MQKPSKFYLFVIILSVSLTMSYMRGRYSYSAVISCYSEFPDLRNLTLRGMQQIISELPRQTCREIKSSMTLEEEQLCDWTHMASAFFRGHGKGRMHTSVYLQPAEFSKNTHLSSTRRILNQLDKKVCAHQIQFWFYKKQDIRNNPLWASWLFKDALLHTRDACCTLCCGRTEKPLFY